MHPVPRLDPPGHLALVPVTHHSWCLWDDRFSTGDTRRLVAYVERAPGEFDALWLRPDPGTRERFGSVSDLLQAADRHLAPLEANRV